VNHVIYHVMYHVICPVMSPGIKVYLYTVRGPCDVSCDMSCDVSRYKGASGSSAVCAFTMAQVERAFSGRYREVNRESQQWYTYNHPVPEPRPGTVGTPPPNPRPRTRTPHPTPLVRWHENRHCNDDFCMHCSSQFLKLQWSPE